MLRVWSTTARVQRLTASLKEHQGAITCIALAPGDAGATGGQQQPPPQCCSASADGTCVVWDLGRELRTAVVRGGAPFQGVAFHPDGAQLVTVGADRRLSWWDVADGAEIRTLEQACCGAKPLRALGLSGSGDGLATGGGDGAVRTWAYDAGVQAGEGLACGGVTCVHVAPDGSCVVSGDDAGCVMVWRYDGGVGRATEL